MDIQTSVTYSSWRVAESYKCSRFLHDPVQNRIDGTMENLFRLLDIRMYLSGDIVRLSNVLQKIIVYDTLMAYSSFSLCGWYVLNVTIGSTLVTLLASWVIWLHKRNDTVFTCRCDAGIFEAIVSGKVFIYAREVLWGSLSSYCKIEKKTIKLETKCFIALQNMAN